MIIRPARLEDALAMARVLVDTFLVTNQGLMSEAALRKRKAKWTYDICARNWTRTLREIADGVAPRSCIYVAVDPSGEVDEVVGLALGCPAPADITTAKPTIGEVDLLYVCASHQGQGIGRRLVQAVAAHLRRLGMPSLHIATPAASLSARGFYEALGGHMVGSREDIDEGEVIPLVIYSWPDTQVLLAQEGDA